MKQPIVSVLMPVYNAANYLQEAIESILNQTFSNFEFLIFNDGSSDGSAEIVRSFQDPRIRFFDYSTNSGHVTHLNFCIATAMGKYLARMDADDISHPERLEKQVHFLERHAEVGICGTWFDMIGEPTQIIKYPIDDIHLRIRLLQESSLGHPTVMMRTGLLRSRGLHYKSNWVPAEDYRLWVEASAHCQLANIPEVLLHYRRHQGQISTLRAQSQVHMSVLIRSYQLERLLDRKITKAETELAEAIVSGRHLPKDQYLKEVVEWLKVLQRANGTKKFYEPTAFSAVLTRYWKNLLIHAPQFNLALLQRAYVQPEMESLSLFTLKENAIFILKCLLHWHQRGA